MIKRSEKKLLAFSLIELSIVILIIGILVIGITKGSRIIYQSRITGARTLTTASPAASTDGLVLWLEATSEKSFNESERVDGALVSKWYDINPLSTVKYDAVQNTNNNKPSYKKDAINGLPALVFDGVLDCISSPLHIDSTEAPNMTFFVVYKVISDTAGNNALFGNDNGAWDRFVLTGYSGPTAGVSDGTGLQGVTAIGNIGKPQIVSYISRNLTSNGSSIFVNRNFATLTFNEARGSGNSSYPDIAFGAIAADCTLPSNVYIGEAIIFNRALKASERIAIEDYLSRKWNIKLS